LDIAELLAFTVSQKASDLHLSAGMPPMLRIDGDMKRLKLPDLEQERVHAMIYDIMNDRQRRVYEQKLQVDFSFALPDIARFRVNAFKHHRGSGAVFRVIPSELLTLDDIGAPPVFRDIIDVKNGLVLVTGVTGSGKSTTLAACIDYINKHRQQHILTIEDPIEFLHVSNNCLINQRELGEHTQSFSDALSAALREDPDVILVGEMRDLETIRLALTAAETGHLVFGTLHTSSAVKTIDRIIDVFPGDEKDMVRSMLSNSIRSVISQSLLKKIGGGRIAAWEIMVATPAIRNLIREHKLAQMYSALQTGQSVGMQTMDQHLRQLVDQGLITSEAARGRADQKGDF
jgi:twitching motility protein PilT